MSTSQTSNSKLKLFLLYTVSVALCLTLIFSALKIHSINKSSKALFTKLSLQDAFFSETQYTPFGEDGVHLFKNLYAKHNEFLLSSPNLKNFLPNAQYSYEIKPILAEDFNLLSQKGKTKFIPGTTLILASDQTMKKMQTHYFHFLEEFILGWSAYKYSQSSDLNLIIFPDTEHWEGFNSISKQILTTLLPTTQILNSKQYEDLTKKYLIQFEKAIFVDRMSCHNLAAVQRYNKMAIAHAPLIKREYLAEFKTKILNGLETKDLESRPKTITYINRKNRRYLEPEFRESFIEELKKEFPDFLVQAVWFEKHSYKEQLQIIRNTDVLIAPHGNGLTHAFFLPDHSLVFEIFPQDAFAMDYQLISELSGHQYYAIDPKHGLISQSGEPHAPRGNVNQIIPPFDTQWIIQRIHQYFETSSTQQNESSSFE